MRRNKCLQCKGDVSGDIELSKFVHVSHALCSRFTAKCKTAARSCVVSAYLVKCCTDSALGFRLKSLTAGAPGTAPSHQPVVCNLTDLRRIKERSAWLHSTGWFANHLETLLQIT